MMDAEVHTVPDLCRVVPPRGVLGSGGDGNVLTTTRLPTLRQCRRTKYRVHSIDVDRTRQSHERSRSDSRKFRSARGRDADGPLAPGVSVPASERGDQSMRLTTLGDTSCPVACRQTTTRLSDVLSITSCSRGGLNLETGRVRSRWDQGGMSARLQAGVPSVGLVVSPFDTNGHPSPEQARAFGGPSPDHASRRSANPADVMRLSLLPPPPHAIRVRSPTPSMSESGVIPGWASDLLGSCHYPSIIP